MRILGWMHRKLRLNSGDSLKDFNIGKICQEECKAPFSRAGSNPSDHYALYAKPFGGQEEEDTLSDLFTHWHQGLLAIGTLGADPVERPLSASDEEEEGDDAIKDAIGLLEKIAAAEDSLKGGVPPNDCDGDAGAKDPQPATEGAKPRALPQIREPLSGVLGTGMDKSLSEKENRVSLRDLFSKNKAAAEESGRSEKAAGAKAVQLIIKKVLKRRSTGSSKTSASKDHVAAHENKIHKLFHMFNRKVHPSDYCTAAAAAVPADAAAAAAATKKCTGPYIMKYYVKDNNLADDKERMIIHADPTIAKDRTGWPCKGHSNHPDFPICGSDSNGNREHWIKTDADFLVLEL
ncbi:unnamed protein product [Victoria cruziana]